MLSGVEAFSIDLKRFDSAQRDRDGGLIQHLRQPLQNLWMPEIG